MIKFKYLVFGIVLLGIIVNYSCKNKEFSFDENDYDKYNFSVKINGEQWEEFPLNYATAFEHATGNYNIAVGFLSSIKTTKDFISFSNIDLTKDTIPLFFVPSGKANDTTIASAFFNVQDDDVTLRSYDLIEVDDFKNWLLLTKIKKKEVRGKFQLVVKRHSNLSIPIFPEKPDTLFFTEGEFVAKRGN